MNPKNKEVSNVIVATPQDAVEPVASSVELMEVLPSSSSVLTESVTLVLPLEKDTVVKTKKVKK